MWPSSVGIIALSALLTLVVWQQCVEGSRLQPDRREVVVLEADNGYIVHYRTRNNPYPIRESVAKDAHEAADLVKMYLRQPIPEPRWGK